MDQNDKEKQTENERSQDESFSEDVKSLELAKVEERLPGLTERVTNILDNPQARARAKKVFENDLKLQSTISKAEKRSDNLGEGPVDRIIEKSKALWRLIKSYKNKEYTNAPLNTIVAGVLALLYFVNPFDLLPDMLPILGQIDDALLLGIVLYALETDLHKFRLWELGIKNDDESS